MFEIPTGLPEQVVPLSWLVGRWQGWGVQCVLEQADAPVLHDLVARPVENFLQCEHSCYTTNTQGGFDALWSAEQGLEALSAGELLFTETSRWMVDENSLLRAQLVLDTGEPVEFSLEVETDNTLGISAKWLGMTVSGKITLTTQKIETSSLLASAQSDFELVSMSRMFGLVGGELMFAFDCQLEDRDYTALTGRLQRVEMEIG